MRYGLTHTNRYDYEQPVVLLPHLLRLKPRNDGFQQLESFRIEVEPSPTKMTPILDPEGNGLFRCLWDQDLVSSLVVQTRATVVTQCDNPFDYFLELWATNLPIDYPQSLAALLTPYLSPDPRWSPLHDPEAIALAYRLAAETEWQTLDFLWALTTIISAECRYQERPLGPPFPPGVTWSQRQGSCRDFVVLFMAACRAVGLATRFVSGYEEGDPLASNTLHAWAEVYLPGAGWRGYDPTLGLAVGDRHIVLAASGMPRRTMPITGEIQPGGVATRVTTEVQVNRL